MCRLIVYKGSRKVTLADLMTKPSHSILRQSYSCRERLGDGCSGLPAALNADGMGIGFYTDADPDAAATPAAPAAAGVKRARQETHPRVESWEVPGVYTSVTPAWSDVNLVRLSEKITSRTVFGHIRAASLGSAVHEFNCHPFQLGRYLWMHNGHVAAFPKLRRRMVLHMSETALACVRGTTDSEHVFGVFLTEVEAISVPPGVDASAGSDPLYWRRITPAEMQACLLRTFALMDSWRAEAGIVDASLLNVCVTDGDTVVASRIVLPLDSPARAASLYFTSGSRWAPAASRTDVDGAPAASTLSAGVEYCMMQADRRETAVIVASERLSANEDDWLTVPKNSLLVVHPSMALLRVAVTSLPQLPSQTDDACTITSAHTHEDASCSASTAASLSAHSTSSTQHAETEVLADVTVTSPTHAHMYTRGGTFKRPHVLPTLDTGAATEPAWMQPWRASEMKQVTGHMYLARPPAAPVSLLASPSLRPQMFCAGRAFQTTQLLEHGACDGAASSAPASPELRPTLTSLNGAVMQLAALT